MANEDLLLTWFAYLTCHFLQISQLPEMLKGHNPILEMVKTGFRYTTVYSREPRRPSVLFLSRFLFFNIYLYNFKLCVSVRACLDSVPLSAGT